jgi:hypothetical protein
MDNQDKAGALIGAIMGIVHSDIMSTVFLSFIGALIGYVSTELFKFIKKKITKL